MSTTPMESQKARVMKHSKVLGDRGAGHVKLTGNVVDGLWLPADGFDYRATRRVGQRRQDLSDVYPRHTSA
jgi:hypothetical protein